MNPLRIRGLFLLAAVAALVGAGLSSGPRPALSANQLLPNLVALPASELQITVADGVRELRFSTTSANLGEGPFEIIGGATSGGSQQIDQRIYNSDGTWTDQNAGFSAYHPQHGHIHVDDYANYVLELESAPGHSVRTGTKQTFCVLDTDRINHKLPGAPKRAAYTTCGSEVQGMSVGWGDTYRAHLFGQSIDITGLEDGVYLLIIQIDPKDHFEELDESDNQSVITIQITGNSVTVLGQDGEETGNGNGNGRGRPW
jgi:hypothetical protein